MQRKIQRWGNSLALRIPKTVATELGLQGNSQVEIKVIDRKLVVMPIVNIVSLNELLNKIKPETLHGAIDWGQPQGNEIW